MDKRNECILFLAHHTAAGAMSALAGLVEQCGAHFTVVPLFDQTSGLFATDAVPGARTLTYAQAARVLPYRNKHAQHPGTFWPRNIDLPLLWFFQQQPRFARYWLMEYDVRYTGDWMQFFRHFDANRSDLLATTIFDYRFRPQWDHWDTLKGPGLVSRENRVRALLSLCRVSNAALQSLHSAYCEGWSGHYEVTVPTILKIRGFSLEDIGGGGAYVGSGNHNRFYRNNPAIPGLAPGTFTVAPNEISGRYPPNMLWHPIKG